MLKLATAILLGSETLRHYLINYARPLIYTTFLSYPLLALVRSAYCVLQTGQSNPLQAHLHELIQTLYAELKGIQEASEYALCALKIPSTCPGSPIFAVQLVNPRALASFLQNQGMMVRAVVSPTVPAGTERVRICLHAGNTVGDIRKLVLALQRWCKDRAREALEGEAVNKTASAKL